MIQIKKLQIQFCENESIIKSNREQLELNYASIDYMNDECREQILHIEQRIDSIKELNQVLASSNLKITSLESSLNQKISETDGLASILNEKTKIIES